METARDIPAGTQLECDILIIGSGAGGITCACELAGCGKQVILPLLHPGLAGDICDLRSGGGAQRRGSRPVNALYRSLALVPVSEATTVAAALGRAPDLTRRFSASTAKAMS